MNGSDTPLPRCPHCSRTVMTTDDPCTSCGELPVPMADGDAPPGTELPRKQPPQRTRIAPRRRAESSEGVSQGGTCERVTGLVEYASCDLGHEGVLFVASIHKPDGELVGGACPVCVARKGCEAGGEEIAEELTRALARRGQVGQ